MKVRGVLAYSPSDSSSFPRSVLRLFWAIPSLKIGCNFHHAFWCGCVCGVTLLLAANSCPMRAGKYMSLHYSEDTNSYFALLNFKTFYAFLVPDSRSTTVLSALIISSGVPPTGEHGL